ncbi:hypothetical protein [Brevundimonas sp. FT23028]|uniref:hypothetical protein n=1 Tax=Brevundimonas sp. FT23028 TaxID=3393748 RepID=UPI003B58720F
MNKIDLLILAGAGAIAAAAGGLWFNHTQASAVDVTKLADGREVRVAYPEGRAQGATARIMVDDPRAAVDPVTQAFLDSARRLQAQPCSTSAKSAYLAALRAHLRKGQQTVDSVRGGTEEAQFAAVMSAMSSANQEALEVAERMQDDGFIWRREHQNVLRAVAPEFYRGPGPEDEQESTPGGRTPACERSREG